MSIPAPGPEYWEFQFGFTSLDEFKAATSKYFDLGGPHIGWLDSPLQEAAWLAPAGATGIYLTAALTASGFHEESPSGPATVTATSTFPLFNSFATQEAAVAALVIPNAFQVSIQMVAGGHQVENVIGVANAAGTSAGAAAAVLAAWKVASGPLANLSNLVAMTNIHAVDIGSSGGTITDVADSTAGGLSTNPALATRGACALLKWNGSNRSRSTRGRMYFGPIREQDIDPDGATVTAANRTTFTTAFTNFRNSLSTAGYPLVVLSRKESIYTTVTAHAVETLLATQRRRIR